MQPNQSESFRVTPDGSVVRSDGSVVYFSIKRFTEDICRDGCCFICGAARNSVPFNDEHVIPRWLLRRHGLFDQEVILPNGTGLRYGQYVLPCCASCNSVLGRGVEERVGALVNAGYEAVCDHLLAEGPGLLFRWLTLVFLKTHLKDRQLRFHRDRRLGEVAIGDLYEWEALHHVHCVARSLVTDSKLHPHVWGSFMCLRVRPGRSSSEFDFGDCYAPKTILLQTGEIGLVAVLNDSCGAQSLFRQAGERLGTSLDPIQLRELAAHLAFGNMLLKDRPVFSSVFPDLRSHVILAEVPATAECREHEQREFGAILLQFLSGATDGWTNWDSIRPLVAEGRYSFLFNDKGEFIEDPLLPAPVGDP